LRDGRCVVSLATDDYRYPQALERLADSLHEVGYTGFTLFWPPGRFPAGCPGHLEVPYAFKPACLLEAQRLGYRRLLWMDSSCVAVRSLDPLFEAIETDGYLLFRNRGLVLGEWVSDFALESLGLTRDEALGLPEVNAAVIGLNLDERVGAEFLRRWSSLARDEVAFRGAPEPFRNRDEYRDVQWNRSGRASTHPRVKGHRHDQTVAGALAHDLGMQLRVDGLRSYGRRRLGRRIEQETIIVIDRTVKKHGLPLASLGRIRWDRDHARLSSFRAQLDHPRNLLVSVTQVRRRRRRRSPPTSRSTGSASR
jgi:hypothetical protein